MCSHFLRFKQKMHFTKLLKENDIKPGTEIYTLLKQL